MTISQKKKAISRPANVQGYQQVPPCDGMHKIDGIHAAITPGGFHTIDISRIDPFIGTLDAITAIGAARTVRADLKTPAKAPKNLYG